MSSFRRIKAILRESVGSYVNGIWAPGTRSTITTMASVQPIDSQKDILAVPEGRHMSDFVKIYTTDRLNVTADGENIQPDIIVHEGYSYEIISLSPNQSFVINHYKYFASKVFKYTNSSDWTTGILKRP